MKRLLHTLARMLPARTSEVVSILTASGQLSSRYNPALHYPRSTIESSAANPMEMRAPRKNGRNRLLEGMEAVHSMFTRLWICLLLYCLVHHDSTTLLSSH
jgi:hypothetical protein